MLKEESSVPEQSIRVEVASTTAANSDRPETQLLLIRTIPAQLTDGRDEMNMAEFPLSAISDRINPSIKTLVFEDQIYDRATNQNITRKLTITGSDAYGLPTAVDEEVLLALVQLSKLHYFTSKRVHFTRHQLIQILKWPNNGQSYQRLEEALNRWMGVTLYYENAWRVKSQRWSNESFHMLERVRIERERGGEGATDGEFSFFEWNETVFKSFLDGNVKALNYDFLLSLRSSIGKRLYRFLDKRFYYSSELEFEIKNLAYEHIGLSRNTKLADIKRKLNFAVDELEATGYLAPIPHKERYRKIGPGNWKVLFRKATRASEVQSQIEALAGNTTYQRLIDFGVGPQKARELVAKFDAAIIDKKLEVANWMKQKGDPRIARNPPGFLITSIENPSYKAPKQFELEIEERDAKSRAEQSNLDHENRLREKRAKEELADKLREQVINEFWACKTDIERARIEEEAMKRMTPSQRKLFAEGGKIAHSIGKSLLDTFIAELIDGTKDRSLATDGCSDVWPER